MILPVQTAMCDNFKGWAISQRMSWASNQMYASRMRLVTFNSFVLSHTTGNVQLRCVSGIASVNRSYVKQFPDVAAYEDYYDIVVDTGEIAVDQYATRVQSLLVQYLRARYGNDTANWCERFWTGDRSRYCLVHSRYGGCNNNMGAEVTWRDIKNHVIPWEHWAFVGTLCRWIATAMGEEASRMTLECQPPSSAAGRSLGPQRPSRAAAELGLRPLESPPAAR